MKSNLKVIAIFTSLLLLAVFIFLRIISYHPEDFPTNQLIKIEKGMTVLEVSEKLKELEVIKSKTAFVVLVKLLDGEAGLKYGDYLFKKSASMLEIARSLKTGQSDILKVSITIPEGEDRVFISELFKDFPAFNKEKFLNKTKDEEGYLFPDTYFFLTSASENEVIEAMESNFNKKIEPLKEKINKFEKSLNEVITMSSILEKEVADPEERRIVSGILWKRIAIGMALQVDAVPGTYEYVGLPKSPVCNPGLGTVEATLDPQKSSYLYYLTGKDGKTYFAKDFEEHKLNKEKYLR